MPLKVGSMMWPRKLLDIGWTDLAFGGLQCIFPRENRAQIRKLEEKCGGYDQAMICLSVRTGFDLLLQALRLPAGSEVIMSAITIPDMIAIVRRHGLVPVPLDLEFNTLAPTPRALQSAITTKTRLIVVAHLFGVCVPMAPIVEVAKEHDLFVVEDCAQSFEGWETIGCSQLSHSTADARLYSFGPIKTATSLGGAVVQIRDTRVLAEMRNIHDRYPVQEQRSFALRIIKVAMLKSASNRMLYGWLMQACYYLRIDADGLVNSLARNFGKRDLLENIRRQPCKTLVSSKRPPAPVVGRSARG